MGAAILADAMPASSPKIDNLQKLVGGKITPAELLKSAQDFQQSSQ